MTVDLAPFPNLLFLERVFTAKDLAIRTDLSQDQLRRCEAAARELKNIASSITKVRSAGFEGLAMVLNFFAADKKIQLVQYLKANCTVTLTQDPQPAQDPKGSSAFWATPPFRVMGAVHQADQQLTRGVNAIDTQLLSAVAFLGLAVAAVARLRFGDTSLLQRLIPAL